MDKKRVIIRVDGNSQIGLGHIYRGIALVEMLKDNFEITFFSRKNSTTIPIADTGFDIKYIPDEIELITEPEYFNITIDKDTIIVLDGYDFSEDYQKQMKEYGFKLVYIDDLAKGKQYADLVINHSPGAKESNYNTADYTKLALGLDYALIRQPFIHFDRKSIKRNNKPKVVFVSFGGADTKDFTYKTVKQLTHNNTIKTINVVLGSAYSHKSIFKIGSDKLRIFQNIGETQMFEIMSSSDLAIIPASTVSIELAALGVPMVLGYYTENQKNIYEGLIDKQLAFPIGDFNIYNFNNLHKVIRFFSDNISKYYKIIKINPQKNITRVFSFNYLTIRNVKENDLEFVFRLSNENEARENSFNSELITYKNHKQWFENQLNKNKKLFFILEYNGLTIGQVRFNKKINYSVIGISVSKNYRGKGFAVEGLILACNKYFTEYQLPIYAYIKKNNIASVKAFEKAGFKYLRDEKVNNIDSFLYIKEINN